MAQLSAPDKWGWRSVRVQAVAVVLTIGVLLVGGLAGTQAVTRSIEQLATATAAARLQSIAAQQVLSTLQDAETGQRGFLLTHRASYLDPYYQATTILDGQLTRLAALARDTAWLQQDVATLAEAARQKMAELEQTIRLAQAQGTTAALPVVLTDAGRSYMDQARSIVSRIVDRSETERLQRAGRLQARQTFVTGVVVSVFAAGLLLLGAGALLLLWNHGKLLRARRGEMAESARLQAAVEHVRDGVAVFDAQQRLTLQNSRFAPTLGVDGTLAAPGATLPGLAGALTMVPPVLADPLPSTRPLATEVLLGGRTLEVWRNTMPDGGQMLAVADISRRVEAETRARQSQKMEVLGQMTGGIAHDFNNLLQVVSANLELVSGKLARSGADQALLDRLAAASTGVARGARLTRHLLAFARRQPLAPEAIDPARLLAGMDEMLRRTLGEAIELEVVIGGGLWAMRVDANQMENGLLNLALNARDAMVRADGIAKGKLTIEVANAALDENYAAARHEISPGQYLMFAVTDNGLGMDAAQLARATEPFYTTKPDGKGTGLGLPMVFGFAKQSGGDLQLYSEPGKGTTARLYIPRSNAAPEKPMAAPQAPRLASGELVLLVEDDAAVQRAAAATLRDLGYTVREASSADEAMALLEAGLRPALLFTDVVMPGQTTARQMATRAVALVPNLAVLFTSGYTQNSIVHNGQLDRGVNLISKPWRADDLAQALRSALDGDRTGHQPALRVLLVEDEALVRMTTADALADLGFEVVEAASGAAALQRLRPPPDLMITDLGLPDIEGRELVAQVRALVPGLPVVIASGRHEPPAGDVEWLAKPYDSRALQDAVARALGTPALAGGAG